MNPRFVDTHCHFDFVPFIGDEAQSLRQAAEAGVEKIIAVGTAASRFAGVMALVSAGQRCMQRWAFIRWRWRIIMTPICSSWKRI